MNDETKPREVAVKDTVETKLRSIITELDNVKGESQENFTALHHVKAAFDTLKSRPSADLPKHVQHEPKDPAKDESLASRPAKPGDTMDSVSKTNEAQKSGKK